MLKTRNLRKGFTIVLVLLLVFAMNAVAFAQVTQFIAKDADDNYYAYDYQELVVSYTAFILGGEGAEGAELYEHFAANVGTAMLLDDDKGYIDYQDVLDAYTAAVDAQEPFNMEDYIASCEAAPADVTGKTIIEVTVDEDGNIVETPTVPVPIEVKSTEPAFVEVDFGTDYDDIGFPATVEATLNGDTMDLDVDWDDDSDPQYDGNEAGDYVFKGTLINLPDGVVNPDDDVKAQVTVTVLPEDVDLDPDYLWQTAPGLSPGKTVVIVELLVDNPEDYTVTVAGVELLYNADLGVFNGEVDTPDAVEENLVISL